MSSVFSRFFLRQTPNRRRSVPVCGPLLLSVAIFTGLSPLVRAEDGAGPEMTPQAARYFVQDYTAAIAGATTNSDIAVLSWCVPDYKVPKEPKTVSYLPATPIVMEAARNDFESFQVVIRPTKKIGRLTASVTDLTGPDGALLSKDGIELRYAYYHFVDQPTDETCAVGWYPDALVPIDKGSDGLGGPLSVEADVNQPVWVTVKVPFGTAAGDYAGTLTLADADGEFSATIPFTLKVWNFDIPKKSRVASAYGFGPGLAFNYHHCQTPEQRRATFERYLKSFSDHRITPYDPLTFDHYRVKWHPEATPPSCEIDFTNFDREYRRVYDQYNFNTYMLPLHELGSGTFASRNPGQILNFTEETPEYQAMFADYLGKLQAHMKELGIADQCYFYWFDEPEPKDYDFVANGFARLTKTGPDLPRMLTEEPSDAFCDVLDQKGGNINIWCPISPNYSPVEAKKRMAKGERFWWYVCTVPKAPYCTEFTDHPGHELRVWLWQTYERKIVGTLVWQTNYWTSNVAFPDEPQNPYLDPMCYVSGYGQPKGTKECWGNGDGRFLYPPLAAASAGKESGWIDEDPVSSIRWEELREGNEDYEFFLMLRERIDAAADSLFPMEKAAYESLFDFSAVTKSMTEFTDSPTPIYEKRRAVAEAIERLAEK